jgi:diaminohydroxyphosphoribosylaminopyrimidine deaminase/5-amino-6-(5-phosphoribosylamino)uracil reductase
LTKRAPKNYRRFRHEDRNMDRRRLAGMLRRWPARAPAVHMSDALHMQRALAAAATGLGRTGENPCVGCAIVRDGVLVAEARTADTGRPHAEEQALAQTGDARGATAYVTLEPCAKRTSGSMSCSDLLIAAGIARVVIATRDPHPFAAGVGIERLRAAGVQVEVGVLEKEARAQNADFFAKWGG